MQLCGILNKYQQQYEFKFQILSDTELDHSENKESDLNKMFQSNRFDTPI